MLTETITAVSDSVQSIPAEQQDSGAGWIMHHILDSRVLDFEPFFTIHLPELHLPEIHLFGMISPIISLEAF